MKKCLVSIFVLYLLNFYLKNVSSHYPKNEGISYLAIAKVGRVSRKIRNTDPTSTSFLFSASTLSSLVNNVVPLQFPFQTLPLPVIARQPEHNRFKATVSSSDIPETELSIGACALVGRFLLDSPPATRVSLRHPLLPPRTVRYLTARRSRCTFLPVEQLRINRRHNFSLPFRSLCTSRVFAFYLYAPRQRRTEAAFVSHSVVINRREQISTNCVWRLLSFTT